MIKQILELNTNIKIYIYNIAIKDKLDNTKCNKFIQHISTDNYF